jgi:hypothetical protein
VGLSGVIPELPERVSIRTRANDLPLPAWRVQVASEQGGGALLHLLIPRQGIYYRGDGVFLGWSQERLAAAYQTLHPELPKVAVAYAPVGGYSRSR